MPEADCDNRQGGPPRRTDPVRPSLSAKAFAAFHQKRQVTFKGRSGIDLALNLRSLALHRALPREGL